MKLPNPEKTLIDDNKLSGYSLNFNHYDGQHKARVFKVALNLTIDNIEELKTALLLYEIIRRSSTLRKFTRT